MGCSHLKSNAQSCGWGQGIPVLREWDTSRKRLVRSAPFPSPTCVVGAVVPVMVVYNSSKAVDLDGSCCGRRHRGWCECKRVDHDHSQKLSRLPRGDYYLFWIGKAPLWIAWLLCAELSSLQTYSYVTKDQNGCKEEETSILHSRCSPRLRLPSANLVRKSLAVAFMMQVHSFGGIGSE